MVLGEVGTAAVEYILEELHHLLDIFLATFVFVEGLQLLLCQGDLVGTQGLDTLTEYGSRFVERELAVEVSLLGVEYDLELLHIDLGQVIAHILHTGREA